MASPALLNEAPRTEAPSLALLFRESLKVGCLGFGGPAGQIALMHRVFVDERKWIGEARYQQMLAFCMLLPGPEAQQLATYVGWRLRGWAGALIAGWMFVLPGALVMLGLTLIYVLGSGVGLVEGALFGIKAAVLVIVAEALIRIGRRALKTPLLVTLAALAFVAIFFFALPFTLIVAAAAIFGFFIAQTAPAALALQRHEASVAIAQGGWRHAAVTMVVGV